MINSTSLSTQQIKQSWDALEGAIADFSDVHGSVIIGSPDFYRGDSWQILIDTPALSLRLALLIRARLRSELETDTRISIGMGSVETIHEKSISMSQGEAFTLSGHSLDTMTAYFDLTGQLPDEAGHMNDWFRTLLYLCSEFVQSWTRRQAEIVSLALLLKPPKHANIAKSLTPPVAKQTVTDSLKGAHWRALQEALKLFEATDWQTFEMTK
jgi:hypothetical protein